MGKSCRRKKRRSAVCLRPSQWPRPATGNGRAGACLSGGGAMIKIAMSAAASALLRGILARADVPKNRILLTEVRSVDWQSLTFIGERHEIELRIPGPGSNAVADRMCAGLSDAEFDLPGQTVADIAVRKRRQCTDDGSTLLTIEA